MQQTLMNLQYGYALIWLDGVCRMQGEEMQLKQQHDLENGACLSYQLPTEPALQLVLLQVVQRRRSWSRQGPGRLSLR